MGKVITIEEFKEENTKLLQGMLAMNGGFDPLVTGLIIKPDGQYAIAIFPLPKDAFENEESKKRIPLIIPKLFNSFKKDGITPVCFSFTSEAWLRQMKNKDDKIPDDWKDIPKREAFISSYETAEGTELHVNLIHREGKTANADGELIDAIRLERVPGMESGPSKAMGGTLMNMFYNEFKNLKKMGRVQIEELPVYKTLYYVGTYTKDVGNDDEYRPEDFRFTLGVTTNEAEDDIEDLHITWGIKPYNNDEERHTVEGRIINNYYSMLNHDAQINE